LLIAIVFLIGPAPILAVPLAVVALIVFFKITSGGSRSSEVLDTEPPPDDFHPHH